jgi:hypothetical protein
VYEVTIYTKWGAQHYTGSYQFIKEVREQAINNWISCSGIRKVN